MKDKKYIVCPGKVKSQSDGEFHYISSDRIMKLYGVEHYECIVVDSPQSSMGLNWQDYVVLRPRTDGNYSLRDLLSKEII